MTASHTSFRMTRTRLALWKRQLIIGLNEMAVCKHPLAKKLPFDIVKLILEQLAAMKIGARVRGVLARRLFHSMLYVHWYIIAKGGASMRKSRGGCGQGCIP